jgi:hypothetical protein
MSLGDFDAGATLYFKFTTFRPSTGAPFTLAGSPAISVYKDASTTQSTSGVTLTADFDSVTGLNHVAIDTSADGAFYAAGSFFDVVVTTGTVDSVSAVGVVVGRFTLRATACLKPTTSGRTIDVSAGGEAGIDLANVGSPNATLNLSGTTIKAVTDRVSANTDQLAGQTVTAAAGVTFPSTVSSLTAAGVRTELATELGRIDVATSTRLAGSSYTTPPTAGEIADAVWDETIGDHLTGGSTGAALNAAGSAGDPWTTPLPGSYTGSQAGKILADILVDTGTTLQAELDGIQADTEDIQSRLPAALVSGRMDASVGAMESNVLTASALATDAVGEIADGVWDEAYAGHTTAGSFGKLLDILRKANYITEGSVAAGGTPTTTSFRTNLTAADGTYDNQTLLFISGALAGESVPILTYAQTNGLITTQDALTVAPTAADEFVILPDHVHSVAEIADGVHDETVEGSETLRQAVRLIRASTVGKSSGFPSGPGIFRDAGDTKARITATFDADGNRTAVTTDAT